MALLAKLMMGTVLGRGDFESTDLRFTVYDF
jgi:hypothetical protein